MAISNIAALRARQVAPNERLASVKLPTGSSQSIICSTWAASPSPGSAPSTAEAPTRANDGALGQANGASAALRLVKALMHMYGGLTAPQLAVLLVDRLSHQGGLSGTVTAAQTTNLPTAALTRYTSGDDVRIGLEIYTAVGTTATTVTASYTNQDGTSGRTTLAVPFGGTGNREVNRFITLPLQQGDYGVRSVESVTVLATTGTAGNFGVTLYRPLAPLLMSDVPDHITDFDPLLSSGAMFPEIIDNACLHFVTRLIGTTQKALMAELSFAED